MNEQFSVLRAVGVVCAHRELGWSLAEGQAGGSLVDAGGGRDPASTNLSGVCSLRKGKDDGW